MRWASLAASCTAGKARHSLMCSHWHRRSLLALSCTVLGQGVDLGKVKFFLLPSSLCPISDFFFLQQCVGTSLLNSWMPTKALSFVCQNRCSLGGRQSNSSILLSPLPAFYVLQCKWHKYLSFWEENNFNVNAMDNYGFCVVLFDIDRGLEPLLLGITLGTLLENVTLLFSL